ncbi:hypothetical protein AAEX28_01580 [Lentisphaerota bacterium WC36G]|nr:hypothetical protein LJT99_04465 [Lentisphaerae bacterium WC36]
MEAFNTWYGQNTLSSGTACYEEAVKIFDEILELYKDHGKTGGFMVEEAEISANKDRRICAAVQTECSNEKLAEIVGLEKDKINSWLKEFYAKGNSLTQNMAMGDTEVKLGQCYSVPNVLIIIDVSTLASFKDINTIAQLCSIISINSTNKEGYKGIVANKQELSNLQFIDRSSIWGFSAFGNKIPLHLGIAKKEKAITLKDIITAHYYRNLLNKAPKTEDEAKAAGYIKLSAWKSKYHSHPDNGDSGKTNGKKNKKYVSKDGKHEAVYDENGKLVTNNRNQGTYNYASPDDWFGHFIYDMIPYFIFGNTPNDPTPFINRVSGPNPEKDSPIFGSHGIPYH